MKSSFKHIIFGAIAFVFTIIVAVSGDIPQFAKNYVLKRDVKYRGSYRRPQM